MNIDVIEYRKYLENYYRYNYDKDRYLIRKKYIDVYSDEYLKEIINNTKIFIVYLIYKMKDENILFENKIYTKIDINNKIIDIFNGCIGGYPSDFLYNPKDFGNNFYISNYLLKKYLESFTIYLEEDTSEEYNDDEECGVIISTFKLNINTSSEVFDSICNNGVFKDNINVRKKKY